MNKPPPPPTTPTSSPLPRPRPTRSIPLFRLGALVAVALIFESSQMNLLSMNSSSSLNKLSYYETTFTSAASLLSNATSSSFSDNNDTHALHPRNTKNEKGNNDIGESVGENRSLSYDNNTRDNETSNNNTISTTQGLSLDLERSAGLVGANITLPNNNFDNNSNSNANNIRSRKRKDDELDSEQSSSLSTSPPTPTTTTWWLDDIDEFQPKYCGLTKCAYHSKSSSTRGYLVAKEKTHRMQPTQKKLKTYRQVYDAAQQFVAAFGIRHLYGPEPPDAVKCTQEFARKVNYTCIPGDIRFGEVVIQPMRYVSEDTRLNDKLCIDNDGKNLNKFQQQLFSFNSSTTTTLVASNKITLEQYEQQLLDDYNATKRMVASPVGNDLFRDFQVLFDVRGGRIYQFDLDRGNIGKPKPPNKMFPLDHGNCLLGLERRIALLLDWKKKQLGNITLPPQVDASTVQ